MRVESVPRMQHKTLNERLAPAIPAKGIGPLTDLPSASDRLVVRADRPILLTLIDAEEDFNWNQPFSRSETRVDSMRDQVLVHKVFSRYGVKPNYLVDYPVVTQPDGYGPLRELLDDQACEIGAQLHPWVNPPFTEDVSTRTSFMCNLPVQLQADKVRILREEIEARFGFKPLVFRAGRYGLGQATPAILREQGFRIDSSVNPRWDFSDDGGPNFSDFDPFPYWTDPAHQLLEVPLSSDYIGVHPFRNSRLVKASMGRVGRMLRIPGALARAGISERIKISPEGVKFFEARKLALSMVRDGHKVFVLSYHTPSLRPGNTPYVRDADGLRRFVDWLDQFYDFFTGELNGLPMSCSDFWTLASKS